MELIDAGLMFNSPYPPLLRKQRSVDLILSFDFSARESDEERPFKVKKKMSLFVLKVRVSSHRYWPSPL